MDDLATVTSVDKSLEKHSATQMIDSITEGDFAQLQIDAIRAANRRLSFLLSVRDSLIISY